MPDPGPNEIPYGNPQVSAGPARPDYPAPVQPAPVDPPPQPRPQPTPERRIAERRKQQVDEYRLRQGQMHQGAMDRTMRRFVQARTVRGLTGTEGTEIRKPGWLRRTFLRIPILLGLMTPGPNNQAAIDATISSAVGLTGVKDVAQTILQGTLPTAAAAAGIGFGVRAAIDGVRAAIFKNKSVHFLARSIAKESANGGRSWDHRAAWSTIFGNNGDAADLEQLRSLGEELAHAKGTLGIDKSVMKNMIRKAFVLKLDKETLARALPMSERNKLTEVELAQLQIIDQSYEEANRLLQREYTAAERMQFLENELPGYVQRREFTNLLKVIGKRSVISAFKTSLFGSAVSLFRGLSMGGLIGKAGNALADSTRTGIEATGIAARKVLSHAGGAAQVLAQGTPVEPYIPEIGKLIPGGSL